MAEAEADAKVNYTELDKESMRLTDLVVKWLKIFTTEKLVYMKHKKEYDAKYKGRWEYYSGKGEEVFPHRLLKSDVDLYLNNDPAVTDLKGKMDMQVLKMDFAEGFIKALHARGFNLRNAMEYIKFTSGAI